MNPKNAAAYQRGTTQRGFLREPPTSDQFERVTLGLQSARSGERLVVKVIAALNGVNGEPLRKRVVDAVVAGVRVVEIDLSACEKVDLAGLGKLLSTAKHCDRYGARVELRGASDDVRTRMRRVDMEKLFTFAEEQAEHFHSPEAFHV